MTHYYGTPLHRRDPGAVRRATHASAPATDAQTRCDAIQAEYRAGGQRRSIRREPSATPRSLIPTDDTLSLRLSEELDYARRMLDRLGDALTADSFVLARHGIALQSIDVVGQILGHIGSVVRSSDRSGAVALIGMADLKGRLNSRLHRLTWQ